MHKTNIEFLQGSVHVGGIISSKPPTLTSQGRPAVGWRPVPAVFWRGGGKGNLANPVRRRTHMCFQFLLNGHQRKGGSQQILQSLNLPLETSRHGSCDFTDLIGGFSGGQFLLKGQGSRHWVLTPCLTGTHCNPSWRRLA